MPFLGEARVRDVAGPRPAVGVRRGVDLLHEARERERAGCIPEAIERYEAAIAAAQKGGEQAVLAEGLRRLAILRHHRDDAPQPASFAIAATTWRGRSPTTCWR